MDYGRSRRTVHRQLRRFGGLAADQALLIRGAVTRRCRAARLEYTPRERGLFLDGASRILISALSLELQGSAPPHHEFDQIFYAGGLYNIVQPIQGPRQDDPTCLFHDCSVMFVQNATYITGVEYLQPIGIGFGFDAGALASVTVAVSASLSMGMDIGTLVTETQWVGLGGVAMSLGFDADGTVSKSHELSASMDMGFGVESVPEATNYVSASFAFGPDFNAAVLTVEITNIIAASFSMGFDMEPVPQATQWVGLGGIPMSLGFDAAASPQAITEIVAAMSFGFDVVPVTHADETYIPVAFSLGFDALAVVDSTITDTPMFAISHTGTPFISIYNSAYNKLSNPATLPAGANAWSCAWSPNGRYLAVGTDTTPFIQVYDFNSGSPVKLANPATLPADDIYGIAWHPSGDFFVCVGDNTTVAEVYFVNGTTITRAGTTPSALGVACLALCWNPVEQAPTQRYLYRASGANPKRNICTYTNGSFTNPSWGSVESPAASPAGSINHMSVSPDGNTLAIAHNTTPFFTRYSSANGSWVKMSDVASIPNGGNAYGVKFSPDGSKCGVSHGSGDGITIYNTSDWSKRTAPGTTLTNGYDIAWTADSSQIMIAGFGSPYFHQYRVSDMNHYSNLTNMPPNTAWGVAAHNMPNRT